MKTIVGILDSIRAHQKIGKGRNSRRHYTLLASDVDAKWVTDYWRRYLRLKEITDMEVKPSVHLFIVITHAHPGHFGLVGRLVQHTKAKIVMHELENAFVHKRFLEIDDLLKEMGYWLRINGVPETTLKDKQLSRFQRKYFLKNGIIMPVD